MLSIPKVIPEAVKSPTTHKRIIPTTQDIIKLTHNEGIFLTPGTYLQASVKIPTIAIQPAKVKNISNVIKYLSIEDGVDGIISGDDVATPKPSPDCFLRAMDIVGSTPNETIIFEDSEIGISAAKSSGAGYVRINFDNL
jgi:beta-phosphoglucomutase-like phosphatase (HAD superfamily)